MHKKYIHRLYTTEKVEDSKDGFGALDLYAEESSERKFIGRIIYWDATGQFYAEPFKAEVPLGILEEFIAEAKAKINAV